MAHNPEDTADAVAETGAGYKVNVRACGTAEIALMETGRNAEEIRAFYDPETDTVVVNTDRVRPSEVPYLFLHEVAVHKGKRGRTRFWTGFTGRCTSRSRQ